MTTPFVTTLRSRPDTVHVGASNGLSLTYRVQLPEMWDVVRVTAVPTTSVETIKAAALAVLDPNALPEPYVMKLRGFEVLDESASLEQAGAVDGSIFLLTHRRRRPVR